MDKERCKRLALLGLTSGLCISANSQAWIQANDATAASDQLLAAATKHGCPGKNGCPGVKNKSKQVQLTQGCGASCKSIVADREKSSSPYTSPDQTDSGSDGKKSDANDSNLGYRLLSEDELLLELNDHGTKLYNSLDQKSKTLVRTVASARCNGTNECSNLNACKTEENQCAGQGSCQGQGKCAFADKNLAVKVVYDKMNNKRSRLLNK